MYQSVNFLLLAEFDIDVGSKIRWQYPAATGEVEG